MEDALHPIPKILDSHEKKRTHKNLSIDADEVMADLGDIKNQAELRNGMPTILLRILQHFIFALYRCPYMVFKLYCNLLIVYIGAETLISQL